MSPARRDPAPGERSTPDAVTVVFAPVLEALVVASADDEASRAR